MKKGWQGQKVHKQGINSICYRSLCLLFDGVRHFYYQGWENLYRYAHFLLQASLWLTWALLLVFDYGSLLNFFLVIAAQPLHLADLNRSHQFLSHQVTSISSSVPYGTKIQLLASIQLYIFTVALTNTSQLRLVVNLICAFLNGQSQHTHLKLVHHSHLQDSLQHCTTQPSKGCLLHPTQDNVIFLHIVNTSYVLS